MSEFDVLLTAFACAYEATQQAHRENKPRQRAVGAGRRFTLAVENRLLLGLVSLRLYVRQSLLSYLFGLDESNVSRELQQRTLPLLLQVLPTPLRDAPLRHLAAAHQDTAQPAAQEPGRVDNNAPATPKKRLGTLAELLAAYPELEEVLVDATEQPTPQPQDKPTRKQAYSGKQHTPTVKTQIVATKTLILHVFGGLPGGLHDMTLLRASGVLAQARAGLRVRADKGYQGADTAYPHLRVLLPRKKPRKQEAGLVDKAYNHLLSVLRMPVEHHFARVKKYVCMADVWRGPTARHEDTFCVVAGLLNFRQTGQLTLV